MLFSVTLKVAKFKPSVLAFTRTEAEENQRHERSVGATFMDMSLTA